MRHRPLGAWYGWKMLSEPFDRPQNVWDEIHKACNELSAGGKALHKANARLVALSLQIRENTRLFKEMNQQIRHIGTRKKTVLSNTDRVAPSVEVFLLSDLTGTTPTLH
ncbi:MAG: hypothetical protein HQL54_06990 [Magnetococcales bacterium]|nr:hypothetical protein [Magnetococcales bacterium]